jgi:hypothetical protein
MSAKKKPKKFRSPNVPLAAAAGLGAEVASVTVDSSAEPRAPRVQFDYTHVRQDLRRIGILAGTILVVMVALSFFIR